MTDITGKTQIALRMDSEILAEVDARAKSLEMSRNQWFENMTRWVLDNTTTVEQRMAGS